MREIFLIEESLSILKYSISKKATIAAYTAMAIIPDLKVFSESDLCILSSMDIQCLLSYTRI